MCPRTHSPGRKVDDLSVQKRKGFKCTGQEWVPNAGSWYAQHWKMAVLGSSNTACHRDSQLRSGIKAEGALANSLRATTGG